MTTNSQTGPTMTPSAEVFGTATDTAGATAPAMSEEQLATLVQSVEPTAAPTLEPPTTAEVAQRAGITAAWHTNRQIDALWSIDEPRNVWVHIVGVGWRKLYNGRDGAFLALTTLASQARQTNRIVNLREEADGMLYEIYLW